MRNIILKPCLALALLVFLWGCRSTLPSTELGKTECRAQNEHHNGNYGEAVKAYWRAMAIADASSAPLKKQNELKHDLGNTYEKWAFDLAVEGDKKQDPEYFRKAIAYCKKAAELNPRRKGACDGFIEKYEKRMNAVIYKKKISIENLDPAGKDRQYKIDILFAQGKVLYDNKLYSKATDKFEEILVLDPFNQNAIDYLRKTWNKIRQAGVRRSDVSAAEAKAEAEWKGVSEILPQGENDEPVSKKVDIEAKLLIVVPEIDLLDVPVKEAFDFLEKASAGDDGRTLKFEFEGFDPKQMDGITFQTEDISIKEALNSICYALKLYFVVDDEKNLILIRKK